MSKPTLYIRSDEPAAKSKHRDPLHSGFVKHPTAFTSYHSAVLVGQQIGGYGNFYVDPGDASPTREEQLFLPPRGTHRNSKLDAALMLD